MTNTSIALHAAVVLTSLGSVASANVLVAGEAGAFRVFDEFMDAVSLDVTDPLFEPALGGEPIADAAFRAEHWLVAGASGGIQLIHHGGEVVGAPVQAVTADSIGPCVVAAGPDAWLVTRGSEVALMTGGGPTESPWALLPGVSLPIAFGPAVDATWYANQWVIATKTHLAGISADGTLVLDSQETGCCDLNPSLAVRKLEATAMGLVLSREFGGVEVQDWPPTESPAEMVWVGAGASNIATRGAATLVVSGNQGVVFSPSNVPIESGALISSNLFVNGPAEFTEKVNIAPHGAGWVATHEDDNVLQALDMELHETSPSLQPFSIELAGKRVYAGAPGQTAGQWCSGNHHCGHGECVDASCSCVGRCESNGACYEVGESSKELACQVCISGPWGTGWALAPNGTPCTGCGGTGMCLQGACSEFDCYDGAACTHDRCTAGSCQFLPSGGPCEDSETCRTDGVCLQEGCVLGTLYSDPCDDGNPCTADACDPILGTCEHSSVPDNTHCGETASDSCRMTLCQSGVCIDWVALDGTPCPDGDECTVSEACFAGRCTPGGYTPKCSSVLAVSLSGTARLLDGDLRNPEERFVGAPSQIPMMDEDHAGRLERGPNGDVLVCVKSAWNSTECEILNPDGTPTQRTFAGPTELAALAHDGASNWLLFDGAKFVEIVNHQGELLQRKPLSIGGASPKAVVNGPHNLLLVSDSHYQTLDFATEPAGSKSSIPFSGPIVAAAAGQNHWLLLGERDYQVVDLGGVGVHPPKPLPNLGPTFSASEGLWTGSHFAVLYQWGGGVSISTDGTAFDAWFEPPVSPSFSQQHPPAADHLDIPRSAFFGSSGMLSLSSGPVALLDEDGRRSGAAHWSPYGAFGIHGAVAHTGRGFLLVAEDDDRPDFGAVFLATHPSGDLLRPLLPALAKYRTPEAISAAHGYWLVAGADSVSLIPVSAPQEVRPVGLDNPLELGSWPRQWSVTPTAEGWVAVTAAGWIYTVNPDEEAVTTASHADVFPDQVRAVSTTNDGFALLTSSGQLIHLGPDFTELATVAAFPPVANGAVLSAAPSGWIVEVEPGQAEHWTHDGSVSASFVPMGDSGLAGAGRHVDRWLLVDRAGHSRVYALDGSPLGDVAAIPPHPLDEGFSQKAGSDRMVRVDVIPTASGWWVHTDSQFAYRVGFENYVNFPAELSMGSAVGAAAAGISGLGPPGSDCVENADCASNRCNFGSCTCASNQCEQGGACVMEGYPMPDLPCLRCAPSSPGETWVLADDGIPCGADPYCGLPGECSAGVCVGAEPADCDDGNPCTSDRCHLGKCAYRSAVGDCEDGDACTVGDSCEAGWCVPGPRLACDDGLPCTDDGQCIGGTCPTPLIRPTDEPCIPGNRAAGVCRDGQCDWSPPKAGVAPILFSGADEIPSLLDPETLEPADLGWSVLSARAGDNRCELNPAGPWEIVALHVALDEHIVSVSASGYVTAYEYTNPSGEKEVWNLDVGHELAASHLSATQIWVAGDGGFVARISANGELLQTAYEPSGLDIVAICGGAGQLIALMESGQGRVVDASTLAFGEPVPLLDEPPLGCAGPPNNPWFVGQWGERIQWNGSDAPVSPDIPVSPFEESMGRATAIGWGSDHLFVAGEHGRLSVFDADGGPVGFGVAPEAGTWTAISESPGLPVAYSERGFRALLSPIGSPIGNLELVDGPRSAVVSTGTTEGAAASVVLGTQAGSIWRPLWNGDYRPVLRSSEYNANAVWTGSGWLLQSSSGLESLRLTEGGVCRRRLSTYRTLPNSQLGTLAIGPSETLWSRARFAEFQLIDSKTHAFDRPPASSKRRKTEDGGGDSRKAVWGGGHWLTCAGVCFILDSDGTPVVPTVKLDPSVVVGDSIGWVMLTGSPTTMVRLYPDGKWTAVEEGPVDVEDATALEFNGQRWLVGFEGDSVQVLSSELQPLSPVVGAGTFTPLGHPWAPAIHRIAWTGDAWVVANSDGNATLVSNGLPPVPLGPPRGLHADTPLPTGTWTLAYGGPNRHIGDSCVANSQCLSARCEGHICVPSCLIDGLARLRGERDPQHPCLSCNPDVSTTDWTQRPSSSPCELANCQTGSCDAGTCVPNEGAPCDDGYACTDDSCLGGACVHTPVEDSNCEFPFNSNLSCFVDGVEVAAGQSPQGQPCLFCNPLQSDSEWSARPEGSSCGLESPCTHSGVCVAGSCENVGPIDCDDMNPCTVDSCNDGGCSHIPISNVPCQGSTECSGQTCIEGTCVSGPPLEEGSSCTPNDVCGFGDCGESVCVLEQCVATLPGLALLQCMPGAAPHEAMFDCAAPVLVMGEGSRFGIECLERGASGCWYELPAETSVVGGRPVDGGFEAIVCRSLAHIGFDGSIIELAALPGTLPCADAAYWVNDQWWLGVPGFGTLSMGPDFAWPEDESPDSTTPLETIVDGATAMLFFESSASAGLGQILQISKASSAPGPLEYSPALDSGADVRAAVGLSKRTWLIGGTYGRMRRIGLAPFFLGPLYHPFGATDGAEPAIRALAYSGSSALAAGPNGQLRTISGVGEPTGETWIWEGGGAVSDIAALTNGWLIVGEDGQAQSLIEDGTPASAVLTWLGGTAIRKVALAPDAGLELTCPTPHSCLLPPECEPVLGTCASDLCMATDKSCNDGHPCTTDSCTSLGCMSEPTSDCAAGLCPLGGDISGDNSLNVVDIACHNLHVVANVAGQPAPSCVAGPEVLSDIDCSGSVNVADTQLLILLSLEVELPAATDTNGNGCPDSCEL